MLIAALILAGCGGSSIQTTSGKDYLAKHKGAIRETRLPNPPIGGTISFDEALHQVASIEPTLTFPARIGIAKIGCIDQRCGTVVPLYPEEAEAWSEMAANLGASYGSLIPISPFAMDQALSEAYNAGLPDHVTAVQKVRLAAARHHLDAVIVYEARSREEGEANILAVGDLTIIGAFVLPSRKIESQAYAAGIILDPITGYPYGQVQAAAEDDAFASLVGSKDGKKDLKRATETSAAVLLAAETEEAVRSLRLALTEQGTTKAQP